MGVRYREFLGDLVRRNRGGSSMRVEKQTLNAAFLDLRKLYKRLSEAEWRAEAMEKPAELVRDAARQRQKDHEVVHYYWKGRKTGRRRKRNSVQDQRVRIKPGNLRLSIQHLRKIKKTPFAVIGPNIKGPGQLNRLKNLGRNEKNTSGFYAWMAKKEYSGAESFRKDIMEPALQQSTPAILAIIQRQTDKRVEQIKNQLSLFR